MSEAPNASSDYEGLQGHIRDLKLPILECWENQYADRDYTVHLEITEFTCICPKTGLPDFATIIIDYVPDRLCVELRSLKLYITAFRNVGIFHEHAINRILDDLVGAVKPRRLDVRGAFGTRGGITTTVSVSWTRPRAQQS
jgi:7-cyano-7-deazaguanine reductase